MSTTRWSLIGLSMMCFAACGSPGGGGGGGFIFPQPDNGVGDLGAGGDTTGPVDDRGASTDSTPVEDTNKPDTSTPDDGGGPIEPDVVVEDVPPGQICNAGSTRCSDGAIQVCGPGGQEWNFVASCGQGQICVSGQCCQPSCGESSCGPDGCGGSCGTCKTGFLCDGGQCLCQGSCAGKDCGDDGCGNSCGACDENELCQGFACVCQPECGDVECGPDGCGGTCGTCLSGEVCDGGFCECVPSCSGKQCGDNGCGGSCGSCSAGQQCTNQGQCVTPSVCGNGTCEFDETKTSCQADCQEPACLNSAQCTGQGFGGCYCDSACFGSGDCCDNVCDVCNHASCTPCVPACSGKQCGDNGCGGTCGTCGAGKICQSGQCATCTPSCSGKECGSDGCGGTCGSCPTNQSCASGVCGDILDCMPACQSVCDATTCILACALLPTLNGSDVSCLAENQCNFLSCLGLPFP